MTGMVKEGKGGTVREGHTALGHLVIGSRTSPSAVRGCWLVVTLSFPPSYLPPSSFLPFISSSPSTFFLSLIPTSFALWPTPPSPQRMKKAITVSF